MSSTALGFERLGAPGRARDRARPRKSGENARSEIQHPRVPRCRARARLGTVARCDGADRPLHRRRWQRPLPGYGVSKSPSGAHTACPPACGSRRPGLNARPSLRVRCSGCQPEQTEAFLHETRRCRTGSSPARSMTVGDNVFSTSSPAALFNSFHRGRG
jgi:hypothetical protein